MTTPKAKFEGLALTALREWRPLAEQGNANAQFFLGVMYDKGLSSECPLMAIGERRRASPKPDRATLDEF